MTGVQTCALPISLYLRTPFGKQKVEVFSTKDNKVLWTFYGKTQKAVGKYSLELIINEGTIGMVTTDACDLVNLVSCGCKVGGADSNGVTTEIIDLSTEVELFAPIVDDELSETSEHAIANNVVTLALKEKATRVELNEELAKKVDKVAGKVLSSNDYTDAEKAKLARLENYDDTALKNEVATKLSKTDALVEFAKKQNVIADLANIRAGAAAGATALQKVPDGYATTESLNKALEKKVDNIDGKGLSTNDFTNAEKEKLSKLQNYDDTSVKNTIKAMSVQIVALQKEVIVLRQMIEDKPDVTSNVLGVAKVGYAVLS